MNTGKQRDRFLMIIETLIKRFLPPRIIQNRHMCQAYLRAYLIVNRIRASPNSPFNKYPRSGYLRGIDFYKGSRLVSTLAFAMCRYRGYKGVYPKLLKPTRFDEKLLKSKFFSEIKVPESGNKLLTSRFIPKDLETSISVAKIIWHSPVAKLPRNNEIMPGDYFLKASHGSGMVQKIRYPLREDEFVGLEKTCEEWLENKYGLASGEWWYNTFKKEILIEEPVGSENESISWYFYTFDGVIGQIAANRKGESGRIGELTWFDECFEILAYQEPKVPRVRDICLTQDTKNQLMRFARLIGSQFRFVRVDFLIDNNQKIYLGELTFCPADAVHSFSEEVQADLGSLWSQD